MKLRNSETYRKLYEYLLEDKHLTELSDEQRLQKIVGALLSKREIQILSYIASGVTRAAVIAEKLNINHKTVSHYKHRLFKKLRVKNDVGLALVAVQIGLVDTKGTLNQETLNKMVFPNSTTLN